MKWLESKVDVIIVDDSADATRRLEEVVSQVEGLCIAGNAESPFAALELASRLRPPIMILDMYLADGTGIDVLKGLAARHLDTRVVVVTGAPSTALKKVSLSLGARYFFDKEREFEKIQSALRELVDEATGALDPVGCADSSEL